MRSRHGVSESYTSATETAHAGRAKNVGAGCAASNRCHAARSTRSIMRAPAPALPAARDPLRDSTPGKGAPGRLAANTAGGFAPRLRRWDAVRRADARAATRVSLVPRLRTGVLGARTETPASR